MKDVKFANHIIGEKKPAFIIAEISANHNNKIERAKELILAAKKSGADAVKIQTYTADTMTLNCNTEYFKIKEGPWKGSTLYDLYQDASMPWDWHKELVEYAADVGVTFFSTPFDNSAVDLLEDLGVPLYKIASFEIVDIPLIKYVASKKKPIILSTGMATLPEIELAVNAIRAEGNEDIILLKCTSNYPAEPKNMNLGNISILKDQFNVYSGLSDHSMQTEVAIAAVVLGAKVIEKHFTINRTDPGPDSHFSMEPKEFMEMVAAIRNVESAVSVAEFKPTEDEKLSLLFRRSLFAVDDIAKGELFTNKNVKSIRPGYGLPPKYLDAIINKKSLQNIKKGTPIKWELIYE